MILRRPILLRFNDYMQECIKVLESSEEALPSDHIICQHVRLARISEDIAVEFAMDDPKVNLSISDGKVTYGIKTFEEKLEDLRQQNVMSPAIQLSSHVTNLYLHEIALHSQANVEDFKAPFTEETFRNAVSQVVLGPAHVDALVECQRSSRNVVETFLAMDFEIIFVLPVIFCKKISITICSRLTLDSCSHYIRRRCPHQAIHLGYNTRGDSKYHSRRRSRSRRKSLQVRKGISDDCQARRSFTSYEVSVHDPATFRPIQNHQAGAREGKDQRGGRAYHQAISVPCCFSTSHVATQLSIGGAPSPRTPSSERSCHSQYDGLTESSLGLIFSSSCDTSPVSSFSESHGTTASPTPAADDLTAALVVSHFTWSTNGR